MLCCRSYFSHCVSKCVMSFCLLNDYWLIVLDATKRTTKKQLKKEIQRGKRGQRASVSASVLRISTHENVLIEKFSRENFKEKANKNAKIAKVGCHLDLRHYFFSNRVIDRWNQLPGPILRNFSGCTIFRGPRIDSDVINIDLYATRLSVTV